VEFGTVLVLVVVVVLPIAAVLFAGAFGLLEQLGTGGLSTLDRASAPPAPPVPTPASRMEREAEIRQLVQARHDRQLKRGERPVDVEAELARLLALDGETEPEEQRQNAALREEVRQLVLARNERRMARGQPPLDVDAEIERQLRDAGA
jgi:hypothetical protein